MKICDDLRAAVLQAAIQGKLTKQLPEDGDAKDLLAQISKEKARLIAEKKIKKERSLSPLTETEISFDIPENWAWVKLGELLKFVSDGTHKTPKYVHEGVPFLSVKDISKGYFDLSNIKYITSEEHEELTKRCKPSRDDILVCRIGTLGKAIKVDIDIEFSIFVSLGLLRAVDVRTVDYLVQVINSPHGIQWIDHVKVGGGTHTNKINLISFPEFAIPLPPLAEQHRIVARVEELMARIDELEAIENKLEELKKAFQEDMKAALLQAAMQGKLTEQLPEDGDAEDLLSQIVRVKEELAKENKIKKEKNIDPIDCSETPFEIPEKWTWSYLGDIFHHIAGKALNSKNTLGSKHKYITTSNVYWDHFELDNLKEMYYTDDEVEKYSVKKGDLLVLEGGDIGRTAIWDKDESYCIQNHLHRLRPYVDVAIKYFFYCMMYFKNAGMVNGKGIAIQGLSANALHSIVLPLPPLAEQKRIVEKLDKLLLLCEDLTEEKLMEAVS